jgi:hypothetical protein
MIAARQEFDRRGIVGAPGQKVKPLVAPLQRGGKAFRPSREGLATAVSDRGQRPST